MEIFKQQSKTEMRHLPAVDRFKRYGRKSGSGTGRPNLWRLQFSC